MLMPFVLINFVDGFESTRSLWISLNVQKGLTPWRKVGFKMLSTGMIFSFIASGWIWLKRGTDSDCLFFLVPAVYFVYVLVNRDAFASSFVMMQCLMFSSFLIAELALMPQLQRNDRRQAGALTLLCSIYIAITSVITYQHLYRDTVPLTLVETQPEIERMFWHRKL
jgi:hypothetical protein